MSKKIVFSLIIMMAVSGSVFSSERAIEAELRVAGLDQDEIAEILVAQQTRTESAERKTTAQALENIQREITHRHRLAETIQRTEKTLSAIPEGPIKESIRASNQRTKNHLTELLENESRRIEEAQQTERTQEEEQMRRLTKANEELDRLETEADTLRANIERAEATNSVASFFSRLFGR